MSDMPPLRAGSTQASSASLGRLPRSNTALEKREIASGKVEDVADRDSALSSLRRQRESGRVPGPEAREAPSNVAGGRQSGIPKLPSRRRAGYGTLLSFVCLVLVPVSAAVFYYGFWASSQYVTEFRFTVQDTSISSAAGSSSPLVAALGGSSVTPSPQNYVVVDYLKSRQAVDELQDRINVREMYSRPDIDWWSRFSASRPTEKLVIYWQNMMTAEFDQLTGLAAVKVRAFTPSDAKKIGDALVTLSEELINGIARRTALDAVRFAEAEVVRAEERLKDVRSKLTAFRNKAGVIDPNASVAASNSTLTQTLRGALAQLETNLSTLMRQNVGANSTQIQNLRSQISATREQIATVESLVAKNADGTPLSSIMAEYEQLDMERQFAQNMVTSAMQGLDQARVTAATQHLYITPYVRPALPESSTFPHRLTAIFLWAAGAMFAWTLLVLVVRSVREHYT